MDRRGKCGIEGILLATGLVAVLFALAAFVFAKSESDVSKAQMTEMLIMHPELEDELTNTFCYYDARRNTHLLWMCAAVMLTYAALAAGIILAVRRISRRQVQIGARNMQALLEQVERFQKGDYRIPRYLFEADTDAKMQALWFGLEESLCQLGHYFLSLKERLLQEENSTKALITDISHQLKTPLASLRMSHELATEANFSREERAEFLEQERQEIARLEILLAELVNVSRLESHMIQIRPEMSGIRRTLTEAVNQVYVKALGKHMDLEVDIAEDILVSHDPKWTAEALVNVLDNAIKYSEEKTHIVIRVKRLPTLVLIEVEDEGMGIAPEEMHKIFHRFYRGDDAARQVEEGVGVGLYLARRILEEQGGTITAKRKTGGTIFRMTLPL